MSDNKQHFMETEDGRKYPIVSISMMDVEEAKRGVEAEFRAAGEPLDPPTFILPFVAGGDKVERPLDETSLEAPGDEVETFRRKSAWAFHVDAKNRLAAAQGKASISIVLDGLAVPLPPIDDWIKRRQKRHIRIPPETLADPDELLLYYKMCEILKTPGDILRCQNEILLLSSSGAVDREAVEAASDSFLHKLQDFSKSKTNLAPGTGETAGTGQLGA